MFLPLALVVVAGLVAAAPRSAPTQHRVTHDTPSPKVLRFRNGSFHISVFEDLHFGENAWEAWGPAQDVASARVLGAVLDAETPDLAVLNGDLITGENAFRDNATVYVDQIVAPLEARGVPWASTYGNHDSDVNLSRSDLLAREMARPLSRTCNMLAGVAGVDEIGATNYYLPVYGSGSTPRLLLWFFDSRGGFAYQTLDADGSKVALHNWVDARVAAWFVATHDALQAQHAPTGPAVPSLVFVHIPPMAARAMQTGPGIDAHTAPGINDDRPLAQQGQGWCANGTHAATSGDTECYAGQDAPFMEAVTRAGNGTGVVALFSGHDHGNSWCRTWAAGEALPGVAAAGTGVHVCFGQRSGYGGYGSWTRGARQIRIDEADLVGLGRNERAPISTWIRLETGDVVGRVRLNATYGRDAYPATPDTHS